MKQFFKDIVPRDEAQSALYAVAAFYIYFHLIIIVWPPS